MKGAILQPSYLPWRGVFELIKRADVFVFYDDVQYDKHGWRNRNRVKTRQGTRWLTIPVQSKNNIADKLLLKDILTVGGSQWQRKHLSTLKQTYARAPYFKRYEPLLTEMYRKPAPRLADFTIETTMMLARELGIDDTRFVRSSELDAEGASTQRLVSLLQGLGVDHYISGPAASAYMDAELLETADITLEYMEYSYPEYTQLHPPYDPKVTVLDLLFMQGPEAGKFIWGDER